MRDPLLARLLRLVFLLSPVLMPTVGGAAEPLRDAHGEPLPSGAIARIGTMRFGTDQFALSADGRLLAWIGTDRYGQFHDGFLHVWDVKTSKELHRFPVPRGGGPFFSADGKLVGASGSSPLLWDLATGKALPLPDFNWYSDSHLSADGKILCGVAIPASNSAEKSCQLQRWDLGQTKQLPPISLDRPRDEGAFASRLSPDGRILVILASPERKRPLILYDAANGKELRRIARGEEKDGGGMEVIQFTPDGKILGWGEGKTLTLIDVARRERCGTITEVSEAFAFTPDGKTVASVKAGKLDLWEASTGRLLRSVVETKEPFRSLGFGADGKQLIAVGSGGYRVWDSESGKEVNHFDSGALPGAPVSVRFAPDGKHLAFYSGSALFIWDLAARKEVCRIPSKSYWPFSAAFAPDGKSLAAVNAQDELCLYDPATGKEQRRLWKLTAPDSLSAVVFAPDGKSLAATKIQDEVRVWDLNGDKLITQRKCGWGASVIFGEGGKTVATTDLSGNTLVLDAATGKELRTFQDRDFWGASDADVYISHFAVFNPDRRTLVSQVSNKVRLWDLETAKLTREFPFFGKDEGVEFLQNGLFNVSPDGKALFVCNGDPISSPRPEWSVSVREMATGRERIRLKGHNGAVRWVACSPEGRFLASCSYDSTLLIWDLRGNEGARPLPEEKDLDALWKDLAASDAHKGFAAMQRLHQAGEDAVPFLRARLVKIPEPDEKLIARLIADLDDTQFGPRQKAEEELAKLGERAEPALEKALAGKLSPEARQRIERLLTRRGPYPEPTAEVLRGLRAVEVLESLGSRAAREMLEELSQGAPGVRLTREARASLARLKSERPGSP